jgi:hypothetical protein
MTNRGATPAQPAAPAGFVFQAYVIEPAVPAGSVKTLPDERVELKQYCRNRFGATNIFNVDKARLDPSFTYMKAETLAEYRNARYVVRDMMAAPPDAAVTVADIAAFKAWWRRCHPSTYTLFEIRKSNATWVPQALSLSYKRTFKAAGNCPTGATKTSMFEYKVGNTAAELLAQERQRQATVSQAKAAADAKALKIAKDALKTAKDAAAAAKKEADRLKSEAKKQQGIAKKAVDKATTLQGDVNKLNSTIDGLNKQLAAAPSADAVAALQQQITDLINQVATAQAAQADAVAQAQAAQAAANQTAAAVPQAEAVVDQTQATVEVVAAQADVLEPWYMTYKWHLLAGAAALAGGVYWYMNKQKTAAVPALTKNWLPEPTSPRRPSGLNRNRRHGR